MTGYTLATTLDRPDAMMGLAGTDALHAVAADAKQRLTAALAALDTRHAGEGAK